MIEKVQYLVKKKMQHTQAYSGGAVCRGCRKSFLRGRIFEIDLWSPPLFDGFRGILPKAVSVAPVIAAGR